MFDPKPKDQTGSLDLIVLLIMNPAAAIGSKSSYKDMLRVFHKIYL
jgi:hypothetical protein